MAPGTLDAYHDSIWNLTEFVDVANALLPEYLPKEASGRLADDVNPRLVRHYATIGLLPEPGKDGREARYLFEHLVHLLVVRKLLAEGFGSSAIRDAVAGRSADELVGLLEGGVRVALVPEGAAIHHRESASRQFAESAPSSTTVRARAALLRDVRAKAGLAPTEMAPAAPAYAERAMLAAPDDAPSDALGPDDAIRNDMRRADAAPEHASVGAGGHVDAEDGAGADGERFQTSLASIFRPSAWSRIRIDEGLELHVRDDYRLPRNRAGDEDLLRLLKAALLDLEQRSKGKP